MLDHKSEIRILPGYYIFVEIVFFMFSLLKFSDTILDYKEGTFTLQETNWSFFYLILMFGGVELIFYLIFFSIMNFNSYKGITIFSRFSKLDTTWDQIESISLTVNLYEQFFLLAEV